MAKTATKKTTKAKTEKPKSIRYMIHACPKRMWYVEDFLIPSMKEQGITEDEIHVWNDTSGWGNLKSFVESMKYVKENLPEDESIWHIQDDVLLSSDFAKRTREISMVASGFANAVWNKDQIACCGEVPIQDSWTSFQCVCIPNKVAAQFYNWFYQQTTQGYRLMPWTKTGKCDDTIFHIFLNEKHPVDSVYNVRPNIAEHIDWLIGGSTLGDSDVRGLRCANYWEEWDRTKELQKSLEDYWNERNGKEPV